MLFLNHLTHVDQFYLITPNLVSPTQYPLVENHMEEPHGRKTRMHLSQIFGTPEKNGHLHQATQGNP